MNEEVVIIARVTGMGAESFGLSAKVVVIKKIGGEAAYVRPEGDQEIQIPTGGLPLNIGDQIEITVRRLRR